MKRRGFLLATGAALAAPAILTAQTVQRVIVIGGGSAGMTAAARLIDAGVDVVLLEASDVLGGRMARDTTLADFPIDLGAEWIHNDPEVLGDILGLGWTLTDVETIVYRPQTYQFYDGGRLRNRNLLRFTYAETKFLDTTWYGFFERFVMEKIAPSVRLNTGVDWIEHSADGVRVRTTTGDVLEADRVIVATPISALQSGRIKIASGFEDWKSEALSEVGFGQGLKVFLKFREQFYPDILVEGSVWEQTDDSWDSKLYYNAAFGKDTSDNVLGLFNVAQGALPWSQLSADHLVQSVLEELDAIYDGAPRALFESAVTKLWSQEPNIGGSYSMDNNSDYDIEEILAPINGRIFFAGEALGGDAQSTVQGAAYSGVDAVERILG
ncbi:Monoamine oxidase [Cognatiyoonia sediminum]|uniref:Tryptophan 2-monooxygenase n=1 Tax=Cognatiyoonia sediminum TaxID=1508389 RepID=A0A1M5LQ21_9RHOB|nr:NAD(P)/FAD-dependent oxidoreductase [Cognatiyoonia sediminum]SHG66709.1 Monoamine oxidase [Cognatiyoonia sediminum]